MLTSTDGRGWYGASLWKYFSLLWSLFKARIRLKGQFHIIYNASVWNVQTEWHSQSLALLVRKEQIRQQVFLFIQQVTQVVFKRITFSSNRPGCFDQETTESALAANAKYSKQASSKSSWLVGYSRTHWSTPLSPRPTHRRLEGRQVTVDPAHTADHHCPTTGYPY